MDSGKEYVVNATKDEIIEQCWTTIEVPSPFGGNSTEVRKPADTFLDMGDIVIHSKHISSIENIIE